MMACLCCCSTSFKGWLLPWSCQHWIWTSPAGLKNCLPLYNYGDQGAQSVPIFPVCFQCIWNLLQQNLSYLLHKAVFLSLSCLYHMDFWICGDSVAFYQYCSSCSERCFPGQHHTLAVPVVQCDRWSVFSSAVCESELGDVENSTVQQGTDDRCDLQSLSIFI